MKQTQACLSAGLGLLASSLRLSGGIARRVPWVAGINARRFGIIGTGE